MEEETLSSLLSKPENLLKLASNLGNANVDDLIQNNENSKINSPATNDFANMAIKMLGKKDDKNIKLLIALKPFLSGKRAELIDKICSISKLGGLFSNLGGK